MKKPLVVVLVLAVTLPAAVAGAGETTAAPDSSGSGSREGPALTDLPYQERSVVLAGLLSIVPGLGQVYNEEYVMGGLYFAATSGLYLAALAYAGVFRPEKDPHLRYEAVFLLAVAGGLHVLSVFDATLEAVRVNENLERWSLTVDPDHGGLGLAYSMRF